ncbi:MAG: hypothetical protein NC452_05070 [Eubacterium sp.]|nr:hypothetical protein [Eubacterium sp.]
MTAISENTKIRSIDQKYLYFEDGKENETYQIGTFENFIIRLALKDNGHNTEDCPLLDEIVFLEINHNEILKQIIDKGLYIGGKEYIFFTATTGQVRNSTVTLLKKDFYEKHRSELTVELTDEKINGKGGINIGKYLAYNALSLSSSVLPDKEINIDRCIVVPDLETVISDMVKYIDIKEDNNGLCFIADMPKDYVLKQIPIKHTDGAGMFLPGELPSSCQIRGGYFKGAIFPFDFRKFALEVANNTVITDLWGNKVDIIEHDIRFIFTESQFKMNKFFSSWTEYKKAFKSNNLQFSINSYANSAKDTTSFSYQYLQTLPFGCDIEKLCEPAITDISRLCTDIEYLKEKMKLDKNADGTANSDYNSNIALAIDIYPQIINDPYIKDKIKGFINTRRKNYRGGKIPISGYYSYAAPDLYAFCEYLFCGQNDPIGLVPKSCVYNKYYDQKGSTDRLICLRSPHLSRYEYGKRELVRSEECRKWFEYMENDTVVSCRDLLSKTLQMDWDGDEILVCDDKELLRLAEPLPDVPLYYEMQTAKPQEITKSAVYDTLVKGFENNVIGESSNAITKLWNAPKATADDPIPYDDAINAICAYSNYAIDFPKTGKNLDLGQYSDLYTKLLSSKTLKEHTGVKCPNFFIEAKGKKASSVAAPTQSVADRVKEHIHKQTKSLKPNYFSDNSFNYTMLMNNETNDSGTAKYKVNRYDGKYKRLYLLLSAKKQQMQGLGKDVKEEALKHNTDLSDQLMRFDTYTYLCVKAIKDIFTDKKGWFNVNLAVNYFVDMEYCDPTFNTTSKSILWRCFSHILIENLQRNVQNKITNKPRPRLAYTKALNGNMMIDNIIDQKKEKRTVDITASDLSFIECSLKRYKNGRLYNNDRELLFTLFCMYKEGKENNRLKNGFLTITKKKHFVEYDRDTQKKKKHNIGFNMNKILEISGAKSYSGSLKRFSDTKGIYVEDEKDRIRIKFDFPCSCKEKAFSVNDIYNCIVYMKAYETGKEILKCAVCGRDFIKKSGNQKTCSEKCKDILHRYNKAKANNAKRKKCAV